MKLDIKNIFFNTQVKNGIWLYILQFFQLVVPLLTFPYLTRVLGTDKYGIFSIALNVVTYFQVIQEYGFNYSGTRKLALAKEKEYSEIYSSIFLAKLLLTFIICIIFTVTLRFTNYSVDTKICMLILYGIVVGSLLQQTWVFQGLQVMKYITLINVISRTISVILIFVFVKSEQDIYVYSILYMSTNLMSGIASLYLCKVKFKLQIKRVSFQKIFDELKDGFNLFLTSAMSRIVSTIGIFLLGIYSTTSETGIYSAAQRIPNILILCFNPISQVLFPYLSTLFKSNVILAKKILLIMYMPVMGIVAIGCIVLSLLSKFIIVLLCGEQYIHGATYVVVLVIWVFFSILNNFLGTQTLVASGRSIEYSRFFSVCAFLSIIFNFVFVKSFGCIGAAWANLVPEIVLSFIMLFYIKRNWKKIFSK